MEIKIDEETLRSMFQEAIFASLDDTKRDALIAGGIKMLFEKNEHTRRSKLEELMLSQITEIARDALKTYLAEDDRLGQAISEMIREAWSKVLNDPDRRKQAIDRMANDITKCFERGY